MAARLKEKYRDTILPQMREQFHYDNVMQVPRVVKVSVNMGLGEAVQNPKIIDGCLEELAALTGQKPIITRSKKAIAGFKLRAGLPIGVTVTLRRDRMYEFFAFGFEQVFEIAAEHGTGVPELLDAVRAYLVSAGKTGGAPATPDLDEIAVAIVGRPNVGKSSLVNRLLREERLIVSDIPGTTRDAIDTVLRWHDRTFRIVDTAGIRRPGRVASSHAVEMVSVLTAKRAMERADVAVLVIDASQGATDQDAAIAGEAERLGCGMIIAANKWDLTKGEGDRYYKTFDEEQRFRMKFLDYAPLLHISALTGERASKVLEVVERVARARRTRVSTGELNRFVNVYLNDEDVRVLDGLETAVGDSDTVMILPAMAGGRY